MAINLWKTGGKPTSYNPLPVGMANTLIIPIHREYVLTLKAKSATSAQFRVSSYNSVSDIHQTVTLTPEFKDYKFEWKETDGATMWLIDVNSVGNIIIEDIELVQKPLPRLTINGVDGFKSGKWDLTTSAGANATIIDDETIQLLPSSGYRAVTVVIPIFTPGSYVLSFEHDNVNGYAQIKGIDANNAETAISDGIGWNQPVGTVTHLFNVSQAYKAIKLFLLNHANGPINTPYVFKKPTINLGSIPAPHSKKTGDKMVMPVPKVNLIPKATLTQGYNLGTGATVTDIHKVIRIDNVSRGTYTVKTNNPDLRLRVGSPNNTAITPIFVNSVETFSNTDTTLFINLRYADSRNWTTSVTTDDIQLQLEQGSTATPYKPYAVQVNKKPLKYVPKKNLFKPVRQSMQAIDYAPLTITGDYDFTILSGTSFVGRNVRSYEVKPNTTYTVSAEHDGKLSIFCRDTGGTNLLSAGNITGALTAQARTFTTPANTHYVEVYAEISAPNVLTTFKNLMLEEGETATAFEPYTPVLPRAKTGLAFDGDNYLVLPSMTMDTIEVDCMVDGSQLKTGKFSKIIDARNGLANGWVQWDSVNPFYGTGWSEVTGMVADKRTVIRAVAPNAFTDDVTIFVGSDLNLLQTTKGTLYKITCYLNGAIVAQYDFENPANIVGDKVLQSRDYVAPKKNLFDAYNTNLILGSITSHNITNSNAFQLVGNNTSAQYKSVSYVINVKPNTDYRISFKRSDVTNTAVDLKRLDNTWIAGSSGANTFSEFGFNSGAYTQYRLAFYPVFATAEIGGDCTFYDIQVEEGTTATAFEPYQLITIPRNTKNLIPNFEDARWTINVNADVLGRDTLRVDATGVSQRSSIRVPAIVGKQYLLASGEGTLLIRDKNYGYIQNATKLTSRVVTAPTDELIIETENLTAGQHTHINPQLYELDSKEGTIIGKPIKLSRTPRTIAYPKR